MKNVPSEYLIKTNEFTDKRLIIQRRNELAESVRMSREEYKTGKTGNGSVKHFLNEIYNE